MAHTIYSKAGTDAAIAASGGSGGGSTSWDAITNKPPVIAAGSTQAAARQAIGAGTSSLGLGTTATDAAAGDHDHDNRYVRTVNGTGPDSSGNVAVSGGGGGGSVGMEQMAVGLWYHASVSVGQVGPVSLVADVLYVAPFLVAESTPIDRLACYVTTAATGLQVRMGIYAASRLRPIGSPLVDVVVSGETLGSKQATVDVTLAPGLYFLALAASGSAGVRALQAVGRWSNAGHTAPDWYSALPGGVMRYMVGASAASPLPHASALSDYQAGHGLGSNDMVAVWVRGA